MNHPIRIPAWILLAAVARFGLIDGPDAEGHDPLFPKVRISTLDHSESLGPRIHGDTIVWQDFRDGGVNHIYVWNPIKGEHPVNSASVPFQYAPAIYGDTIVWTDTRSGNRDIYKWDPVNGEQQITIDPSDQSQAAIYEDTIVWFDTRNGTGDIYKWDPVNGEQRITSDPSSQVNPDIHGDTIVWVDYRNGTSDIYRWDPSNGEQQVTTDPARQFGPDIYGDTIVWQDQRNGPDDIYKWDPINGEQQVTTDKSFQESPSIHGDTIVWRDLRHEHWEIYKWDPVNGEQRVTNDAVQPGAPVIHGDTIVWHEVNPSWWAIYLTTMSILPQPAPTQSVILDFENAAPFKLNRVDIRKPWDLSKGLLAFAWRSPGLTPTIDQQQFLPVFQAADNSFEDFKHDVRAHVAEAYYGFGIEFVLSDAEATLPSSLRSRVYYSGPASGSPLGNAKSVDCSNADPTDDALVLLADEYLVAEPFVYDLLVHYTADSTVHEMGHLLGLVHTQPYEQQYMYHSYEAEDRGFSGVPLALDVLRLPVEGLTQNARIALEKAVGAAPWATFLSDAGAADIGCNVHVSETVLVFATDVFNLTACVVGGVDVEQCGVDPIGCGIDVGRCFPLGDVASNVVINYSLNTVAGEMLMFLADSIPGRSDAETTQGQPDILAYFGTPESAELADLDPALFFYAPVEDEEIYSGTLLHMVASTVEVIGDLEGSATVQVPAAIPATSPLGVVALGLAVIGMGFWVLRRRQPLLRTNQ